MSSALSVHAKGVITQALASAASRTLVDDFMSAHQGFGEHGLSAGRRILKLSGSIGMAAPAETVTLAPEKASRYSPCTRPLAGRVMVLGALFREKSAITGSPSPASRR